MSFNIKMTPIWNITHNCNISLSCIVNWLYNINKYVISVDQCCRLNYSMIDFKQTQYWILSLHFSYRFHNNYTIFPSNVDNVDYERHNTKTIETMISCLSIIVYTFKINLFMFILCYCGQYKITIKTFTNMCNFKT